jgi:hypothetical protein
MIDGEVHGAFGYALLEGLRGAADTSQDGQTDFRELATFVVARVDAFGNSQTPTMGVIPTASQLSLPLVEWLDTAPDESHTPIPSGESDTAGDDPQSEEN